jgi:hypothetical protein
VQRVLSNNGLLCAEHGDEVAGRRSLFAVVSFRTVCHTCIEASQKKQSQATTKELDYERKFSSYGLEDS